jgi:hypothetical protein
MRYIILLQGCFLTLSIPDKGHVASIKFSLDQKILAVQRTAKAVVSGVVVVNYTIIENYPLKKE